MATGRRAGGSGGLVLLVILALALVASELRSAAEPAADAARFSILDVVSLPR